MATERPAPGRRPSRRGRVLLAAAVVGIMIAVLALLGTPGQAGAPDQGPRGTLALRRLLAGMGAEVRDEASPPTPPATYVLLSDLRDDAASRSLLAWVSLGGRLVVADPASRVAGLLGISAEGPVGGAFSSASSVVPGCALPETIGVGAIWVAWDDAALLHAPASAVECFRLGHGAYELSIARGWGTVVLLGGSSPFTNALIADGDDARFALGVLGGSGGGTVVFGPPLPPGTSRAPTSLWAALPAPAKAALTGLALALVAAIVVAGRRLGRPVPEEPPSPIPASELAGAVAGLYRRSRAVGHAGRRLRQAARDRIGRRLGLPPGTGAEEVVRAATRAEGADEDRISAALSGAEPASDDELIELGKRLEEVVRVVESSR